MGYEDRDYMQNPRGGGSSIMSGYPVCRFLIIATVVCFVFQIFATRNPTEADFEKHQERYAESYGQDEFSSDPEFGPPDEEQALYAEQVREMFRHQMPKVAVAEEWLQLDTDKVLKGQVWRLLTNAFLHDRFGVWHIALNMLFLYWFGRELEDMLGHREFLAFYLTAAVVASIVYVGLQLVLGERIPAIGASGAVMAVLCLYAIYHPTDTFNLMFFFPIQIRYLVLMYVIYDLHPILLQLSGVPVFTGTAHAAHLGGLLFGYLYYRFGWTLEPAVDRVMSLFGKSTSGVVKRSKRRSVSGRSEGPRLQRLEASLDSILQKISEQGKDSLTDRERKILDEASNHYRNQNND